MFLSVVYFFGCVFCRVGNMVVIFSRLLGGHVFFLMVGLTKKY